MQQQAAAWEAMRRPANAALSRAAFPASCASVVIFGSCVSAKLIFPAARTLYFDYAQISDECKRCERQVRVNLPPAHCKKCIENASDVLRGDIAECCKSPMPPATADPPAP